MRAYAVLLGLCLLPVSVWAQQVTYPPTSRAAPRSMAVPVRGLPSTSCVVGNAVSLDCGYNRGYRYERYGYGPSVYDRRSFELYELRNTNRVYGIGSYRRAYADPGFPACPVEQGGVMVVSPRNPRVIPNRSVNRNSRPPSYALVAGSLPLGCSR